MKLDSVEDVNDAADGALGVGKQRYIRNKGKMMEYIRRCDRVWETSI